MERSFKQAVNSALDVAEKCSPGDLDTKCWHDMIAEMHKDGCDDREVLRHLIGGIYDGLRYGNWPENKERPKK